MRRPAIVAFALAATATLGGGLAYAADPLPADLLAIHQRAIDDGRCRDQTQLNLLLANYPAVIAALSPTDTMYVIPCDFGVINPSAVVYVVTTGDHAGIRPVIFAQYDQDFGWIGDTVQFNAVFDPKTKTLTAHEYYDPAGDCGADGTWVWHDYAFAMVKYRYQVPCDHTQTFATWPVIFQKPADGAPPRPQIGTLPDFFQVPN
jgi:hypothetical protein